MSKFQFPNPGRVLPAPFNLFKWDILDHRGRIVRRSSKHDVDRPSRTKTQSFWSWPAHWKRMSRSDIRQFGLVVVPLVLGYAALMGFGKVAHFAAIWLLPQYFGQGNRTTEELLIRIALSVGFYLALSVIIWVSIHASFHWLLIPEISRAMLRRGKCASCNYPLAGLDSAPDGCTVCPECGAAWKLNARLQEGNSA